MTELKLEAQSVRGTRQRRVGAQTKKDASPNDSVDRLCDRQKIQGSTDRRAGDQSSKKENVNMQRGIQRPQLLRFLVVSLKGTVRLNIFIQTR